MKQKLQTVLLLAALFMVGCSKVPPTDKTFNPQPDQRTSDASANNPQPSKPLPPVDTTTPPPADDGPCAGVFCTAHIAEIDLEVVDGNGTPVSLDAFHTEDMNGNILSSNLYYYNSAYERYIVFTDSWLNGHQNTTTQVRFVGYIGGQKVVDEVYGVHTDCCHIQKTSGKSIVVIP